MVKRTREDAQRMIKSIAVLLYNTTWKCGSVERIVVNYLRSQFRRCGQASTPIKETEKRVSRRNQTTGEKKDYQNRRVLKA